MGIPGCPSDDFQVWQAFKAGSEKAFDFIYDAHFSRLYRYGSRLCPDQDLVKDCIQNLFVALWKNKSHLGDVHSIQSYLGKSLRRSIFKELHSGKRHLRAGEPSEDYHAEVAFSPERMLIGEQVRQENSDRLQHAFLRLTKRQREAVLLRFYQELEYPAIAEMMSLKEVKYARTLVYRSLDALRVSIRKLACVE